MDGSNADATTGTTDAEHRGASSETLHEIYLSGGGNQRTANDLLQVACRR